MLIPSNRKWWFRLDADDGAPGGGDDDKTPGKGETTPAFLETKKPEPDAGAVDDGEGDGLATPAKKKTTDANKAPTGERPSNIPEKFWDAETKEVRVDTLAESYAEAESNLSRLRVEHKVPEFAEEYLELLTFTDEGNLRYSDGIDKLPATKKDDPLFRGFLGSCHKHGLAPEQAIGILKDSFQIMDTIHEEPYDNDAYVAEQEAILGANHAIQVSTAQAWVETLHSQGVLSLNEARALHKDVGRSAHGIMALNKLRSEITGEASIPIHDPIPEDGTPTPDDWYEMKMSGEYKTSAPFKKKVDDLLPLVFPGTGKANFAGLGVSAINANDAKSRQKKALVDR